MKSVLVTGASGFIGRHTLQPLIDKQYHIHAIFSSGTPVLTHPNISWHQVNLHDLQGITQLLQEIQVTHLLHLAWYVKPQAYRESQENLIWLNSSIHLLNAFIQAKGQRAVLTGSSAEYDWQYGHCKEHLTPCQPNTLYGTVKHSLHLLSEMMAKSNDLSFAWARLFFLFGVYEYPERFISSMICQLLKEQKFHMQHGYQIRDFMYVEDVAAAMVALLDSDVRGPVNIASGEPIQLQDLLTIVAKKLNMQNVVAANKNVNFNAADRLLLADVSRLRTEVKWQSNYTLDMALDKTIAWWKERL